MIVPSAIDVLGTIEKTLASTVVPDAGSVAARSALATIGHLLRHVQLRLAHEGQILTEDIAALRALLPDIADWLAQEDRGDPLSLRLRETLGRAFRDPGRYPDLASLAAEAGALRHALTDALARLVALRPDHGERSDYLALRARIRTYLAAQITAETALVDPAFSGRGARR